DTVRIENTKPLFTRAPQRAAVARRSGPQPGRARWSAVWTGAGRMGEGSASEVLGRRPREGRLWKAGGPSVTHYRVESPHARQRRQLVWSGGAGGSALPPRTASR